MPTTENRLTPRRSHYALDLARLQAEVVEIVRQYDFSEGYFGETISLLAEDQLNPQSRSLPYNQPVRAGMSHSNYAYISEFADSMQSEKVGLMLQQREPRSSYGIHRDAHGEGLGSRRFNLPVVSPRDSFLCIANVSDGEIPEAWTENNVAFLSDLLGHFGERLDVYYLEPGYLHTFRFDLPHTVVNEGNDHRYTLLLDYLENEWLETFAERTLTVPLTPIAHYQLGAKLRL